MKFRSLRFYFSLLCFFLVSMSINAQLRTLEKAQSLAAEFFNRGAEPARMMSSGAAMVPSVMWNSLSLQDGNRDGVKMSAGSQEPAFYMFANPYGKGFAIISGDDVIRPVIGYSFENDGLNVADVPVNMREYLLGIADEIMAARNMPVSFKAGPTDGTAIGNVLKYIPTANWGQSDPYNSMCPLIEGKRSLTGCVPTALAIVMRYHEWPLTGSGRVGVGYEEPNRDISGNVYDLHNIPLNASDFTEYQIEKVSQFMFDIGCAEQVEYGLRATSGSVGTNYLNSIMDHFGYKDGVFLQRDIVNNDVEWCSYISEDLEAGRPIAYAATRMGNSSAPDGKHMFVLDGYTDNGFYHFNWGWNGAFNGYYTLSEMTPNEDGNYKLSHMAYFKLTPDVKDVFTLSVSASGNGSVYIGSSKSSTSVKAAKGSEMVLHAVPAVDYEFAYWSLNGENVSQSADYTVTVNGDAQYVAVFVKSGEPVEHSWYYVKFMQDGRYLTAESIKDGICAKDKLGDNNAGQLWEFIEKGTDNNYGSKMTYVIRNMNNVYLCIKSSMVNNNESASAYLDDMPGELKFCKDVYNNNGLSGSKIFYYGKKSDWVLSLLADGSVALVKSNDEANTCVALEKAEIKAEPVLRINVGEGGRVICYGTEITAKADIMASEGEQVNLTVRPDKGMYLASVLFNGTDVTNTVNTANGELTTPAISGVCSLDVKFTSSADIASADAEGLKVYVLNGALVIDGACEDMTADIFTVGGAKIATVKAADAAKVSLAKGRAYIVSIDGRSFKVVL